MTRSILVLMLATLVLGGATAGCKKKMDKDDEAEATPKEPPKPTEVSDAEKTNAYIECSNRFVGRAYEARDRYLSWVDAKKGPTGKEKAVFGTYTLVGDVAKECRAKIDRVAGAKPSMPELEKVGEALVASLEVLGPLLEDASEYWGSGKAYVEDKSKHGQELHPKLMAAFDAFAAADEAMGVQLGALEDASLERQMKELADNPDRVPYLIVATIASGKKVVREVSGIDGIAKVDVAALEAALVPYEAVLVELINYIKTVKVEFDVSQFARDAAPKVAFQSRALIKHRKEKLKWSSGDKVLIDGGNPQMVEGHPAAVLNAYNDMIGASNSL
jgi:hypothetical protein